VTIPLLPCTSIDEMVEFHETLAYRAETLPAPDDLG
jgi:hypothetical protein